VTVTHGKIQNVSVTSGHATAAGTLEGQTAWHTVWPLHAGTRYKVTVTAVGTDGKTTTATSTFKTEHPAGTFSAITVMGHQTYGVGIPIMINFSQAVDPRFRADIEKAINIKSSKPVAGAWYWDGGQTLDFRTRNYWPQHTKVSFDAHFNGAQIAPGVFGISNLSQSFTIGKSLIGVTSTRTHKTQIYWGNKLWATWPDSTGQPGDDTANGTYLTIEKANPTLMSGPGYKNLPVFWQLLPLRALVTGRAGVQQRQPRLREPVPAARRVVVPQGRPRRPDHDHRQPGVGQVGRRVHRVVPDLEAVAQGQRDPRGRAGERDGQHLRQPGHAAGHRVALQAARVQVAQLPRRPRLRSQRPR
jgi:hypothetical protein